MVQFLCLTVYIFSTVNKLKNISTERDNIYFEYSHALLDWIETNRDRKAVYEHCVYSQPFDCLIF